MLLVTSACARPGIATFRANEGYQEQRHDGPVEVFDNDPPSRPFDAVGTIVVEGELTARQVEEKALGEARRVGCQLLVVRQVADGAALRRHLEVASLRPAFGRGPVLVAQVTSGGTLGPPGGGVIGGEKGAARRRIEFVCGVWRAAP